LTWSRRLSPIRWAGAVVQDLRDLHKSRHVVWNFVTGQLKIRYQRSALGFLWTLLNPILMMTVLTLVFSQVLRWDKPITDYALYLFSGMIPWQFFAACVDNGSRSLICNEHLIRKVPVQKMIFPLSDVLVAGANMIFAMIALSILAQLFGAQLHVQLVLLPVGLLLLGMFAYGTTLVAMTLVVRFRDFEHMLGVFLQAFYFMCPILYPPQMVERYRPLLQLNPMTHILGFFQGAIYDGTWPSGWSWLAAWASAVGMLVIGYVIYKWYEDEYIFRL
jgi:ABC-2 type transport system permease protein/lipopolysaccharide transport system permease protein